MDPASFTSGCVNGKAGDPADDPDTEAEANVREVQLVIAHDGHRKRYSPLIGKRVEVTGTLFHAINAHHRTRVLLIVQLVEPQADLSKK